MENNSLMNFENFTSDEFGSVRTLIEDGRPLFCGSDVAKALGYTNSRKALSDHCKGVTKRDTLTDGGKQQMSFIPEGDLYRLIANSKLPSAERFERWVFDEVIPTIRKTGGYINDSDMVINTYFSDMPDEAKLLLKNSLDKIARLQKENALMKPKAEYCDDVLTAKNCLTVSQIAKEYGMSAQAFNEMLRKFKIQYKRRNQWLIRAGLADKGYTNTYTYPAYGKCAQVHTVWTQAGREYLYQFLKKKGIVPVNAEAEPA